MGADYSLAGPPAGGGDYSGAGLPAGNKTSGTEADQEEDRIVNGYSVDGRPWFVALQVSFCNSSAMRLGWIHRLKGTVSQKTGAR